MAECQAHNGAPGFPTGRSGKIGTQASTLGYRYVGAPDLKRYQHLLQLVRLNLDPLGHTGS